MTSDQSAEPGPVAASEAPEKEWWEDPSLPWRHKPTRADIACFSWLSIVAVYGLVMLPLRPVILGLAPQLIGSLGYRTGFVMSGALAATGDRWWPVVLIAGSLGAMKFDWVYWWAGKLWGRNLIEVWSSRSPRARRANERAEKLARRYEGLAIAATFLPIPLPAGVIYAVLGEAGTTLRKFLTVCITSAVVSTAGYMYLGFSIGEPAVALMEAYGQYLWYLSLAILAGMAGTWFWRNRAGSAAG